MYGNQSLLRASMTIHRFPYIDPEELSKSYYFILTTKFPDTVDLELKNVHETTKKFSDFDFILVSVCGPKNFFQDFGQGKRKMIRVKEDL